MKRNRNAPYKLILVLMFLFIKGHAQELLIDGNMEGYHRLSNFEYTGGGYTTLSDPLPGNSVSGNNAVTNNPKNFNANFLPVADHTSDILNAGSMLVIDGGNLGNGQYFWKAGYDGNGFCGLIIGKTYTFSYWVRSVSSFVTSPASQADIRIDFSNATDILLVSGNTLAPLPSVGWEKVTYTFKATDYCVNINLWDNNINSVGNDFALDDFSLLEEIPLTVTYSLSYYGSTGIELFCYNIGGNQNIVSRSLTGPINKKDLYRFDNLIPGNYVLTIVDADGATASCDVVIPINPAQLIISGNTSVCKGASTVLSASGGNSTFEWYSYPTDASITNNTSAIQVVSPKVETNYVVKSSHAPGTENLIYNGDFSLGNSGFGSWHKYLPTNFGNTPDSYGVVKKSSDWDPNFLGCTDHTTGNGNMLVVNGSDRSRYIWEQSVPVIGTTDYVFSFWVKSLSNENRAKLHVMINGSVYNVYPFEVPADNACGNWVKYSVNYFSGWLSEWANITIVDVTNTFTGNDFAIDDITFTAVNSSSIYSDIVVTVNPSVKPNLETSLITENEIQFSFGQIANATGYEVSYTINNGGIIYGGEITDNIYTVNNLIPGDVVKLTVKPIGTGCFEAGELTANTYLPCPVPVASVVKQPTCLVPLGSIKLNTPIGNEYRYSLDGINFQSDPLFDALPEGDYSITIKNIITNCKEVSNLVILNAPSAVLPDISTSFSYKDCAVLLMASSTISNSTIVWNGPALGLDTPNPVKVSVSGKFTATVTDLITGCKNSWNLDVTMPILPVSPSLSITDSTCLNAYGEIVVNFPLGSSYEYSIDGMNYQSSVRFSNLVPKTYNVSVRNILTSCVSLPVEAIFNEPKIPGPSVLTDDNRLCKNSIVSPLKAIALPGATLNWYGTSLDGGTASDVPTTPSTSDLGTTIYYVSQSIGLCESERVPIIINVSGVGENPGFIDLSFCKGDDVSPLNQISPNGIKGIWQPSIINNQESGSYHFIPNPNQCAIEQTINVKINSSTLKTIDWEVSNALGDFQTIKVKASNQGNYLYQLDDETPQTSPLFENASHGYHTIKVFDVNGCSDPISNDKVLVINLPNYFTPNEDSYNDYWDISDLKLLSESSVFIYDRYGKMLKKLFPSKDLGWDGNFLGQKMPSSDYWYVAIYTENGVKKEYRGHFSLKR